MAYSHTTYACAVALTTLLTWPMASADAASPSGTWLRPKTGAHIKVGSCGKGLGMKVVKSKRKGSVGKTIMCNAKSDGPNRWRGNLTSTEDGNTYTGIVTLKGRSLTLQGCVLGGFICKTEVWRRLK